MSGRSPSTRASKTMNQAPDTLLPQCSRDLPATQLGGGALMAPHGAIFHETHSALEWHEAAITVRENLGVAMEIGRGRSTRGKSFRNNGNLQIPCSCTLPATFPQLNLVFVMWWFVIVHRTTWGFL